MYDFERFSRGNRPLSAGLTDNSKKHLNLYLPQDAFSIQTDLTVRGGKDIGSCGTKPF